MMNRAFIDEIDVLIRVLEELKRGTVISTTYHDELQKKIKELCGDINFWLNNEVRVKKCKS